jgi:hypothetical protein
VFALLRWLFNGNQATKDMAINQRKRGGLPLRFAAFHELTEEEDGHKTRSYNRE